MLLYVGRCLKPSDKVRCYCVWVEDFWNLYGDTLCIVAISAVACALTGRWPAWLGGHKINGARVSFPVLLYNEMGCLVGGPWLLFWRKVFLWLPCSLWHCRHFWEPNSSVDPSIGEVCISLKFMQLLHCVVKIKWTDTAETACLLQTNMFCSQWRSRSGLWKNLFPRLTSGPSYVQTDSLSM